MCMTFRHRHCRLSSLIETAKMKVTRREANQEIEQMK